MLKVESLTWTIIKVQTILFWSTECKPSVCRAYQAAEITTYAVKRLYVCKNIRYIAEEALKFTGELEYING